MECLIERREQVKGIPQAPFEPGPEMLYGVQLGGVGRQKKHPAPRPIRKRAQAALAMGTIDLIPQNSQSRMDTSKSMFL